MNESKKELLSYLENVSLFLIGLTLLAYPLIFTSILTSPFLLTKEILIAITTILSLIVLSIRMIVEGRIRIRTTPFDLPILIFGIVVFVSALFSPNRYDALINFVPLFFVIFFFFVMVNVIRGQKAMLFSIVSLLTGTTLAALISTLSFFKIYVLPLSYTHVQAFSTVGSLLDEAIFLAITLPLAGYLAWPLISPLIGSNKQGELLSGRGKIHPSVSIAATVSAALLTVGLIVSIYQLATSQTPLILPFVTGFQTGLASISQDTGRILQGFLFGSGFGTYLNDFTRFKQATYNADAKLWSVTFSSSSSLILELLATTGFLGIVSYLFIIYRVAKEHTFFLPIIVAFVAAFLLPLPFVLQTLIFIVLALFAVLRANHAPSRYEDLEFYLVTLKHGLILAQPEGERAPHDPVNTRYGKILPFAFVLVILALVGYVGYLSLNYVLSDAIFEQSLIAFSQNRTKDWYDLQGQAISKFPYRDLYQRTFSQTNLTIANAVASNQPRNSSPSADVQQQIVGLIQQSINYGRNAVTLSPNTVSNWSSLSSVYRALFGFGQNAEQFAVLTNQQAIALDSNNPQEYIALGGIYYQLGVYDEAIRQFQIAANLKPDYANAYYNLGHAYEAKGDTDSLKNALQAYQVVASLVQSDKASSDQIKKEIDTLNKKIAGQGGQQQASTTPETNSNLNVNQPSQELPEQKTKAEIPAPPKTATATPTPTPTTGATPTPSL
ncbi:MAG TPA: tetratricopeptide repeat protein [Patescibacteria group bacterium]|nr:tetratricopeptide repeat protein [Patescibacteria group bacterium]